MFLLDLFRSYLPLRNPVGFGAVDFIEFGLAVILVLLVAGWNRIKAVFLQLAEHPRLCMGLLAILPIGLRLALLPNYPVPIPSGSDDFSYLLLADTLKHFRLANGVHPMHPFFETVFVLQEPSYSSIFPLGQGIVLMFGWAGVLITGAAFCALCYWMLRGWTTASWALLGGLLAVAEFGPLCKWMNDYWGGYLSACAGCLVFGAIPRLRTRHRVDDSILLGCGIAIQWLTRPFECLLLIMSAFLFFRGARPSLAALVPILLAGGVTVIHNHAVTGHWSTMPYMLSREQYGVPAAFTFQSNPVPGRSLTAEQQLDYEAQSSVHGPGTDTFMKYWQRFASRIEFYRFFLLVPLFLAPIAWLRNWRLGVAALLFGLGTNFYPYFYPHYIAVEACLFLLMSVTGLKMLNAWGGKGRELARLTIVLCAVHGIFWYGIHLAGGENQRIALMRYENWDFINYGDPEGRLTVNRKLESLQGKQLVFVRYGNQHGFHSWISNAADIDGSKTVWAADLGVDQNRRLKEYYPDRSVWLLEPDAHPVRLTSYR